MLCHLLFFTYVFSLLHFIRYFINSVLFCQELFWEEECLKVYSTTQESTKLAKINYFSFIFKFNENKKVLLKNMVWRGGLTIKALLEGDLIINRAWLIQSTRVHYHFLLKDWVLWLMLILVSGTERLLLKGWYWKAVEKLPFKNH